MELTDTHCHIYLPEFDADRDEVIERAIGNAVTRMFLPNVDSTTTDSMLSLASRYPGHCLPMMGLHPTSVGKDFGKELQHVESMINRGGFYGIGEIGIDLYWDKQFAGQQEEAFRVQIEWAAERDLPVVIHVRNSHTETLRVIRESGLTGLKGIFHCFSGTSEEAREILDLGFLLGIGGVSTFKNSGLPGVLPQIGPDHLVLETDAPYLAPVPHRGKRNEPSYLALTAARVASILGIDTADLARITTANSRNLFGI
jgi:TatD DNase family protein